MSVNKVILIGHLGKDPEIKYTASGAAVSGSRAAACEWPSWLSDGTRLFFFLGISDTITIIT